MSSEYADDDLVYVDAKNRKVVGRVEWSKEGNPMRKEMLEEVPEGDGKDDKKKRFRKPKKRYYPWGTYKTMRKLYRLEGREKEENQYSTFDEALQKSMEEPFWD